MRDLYICMTVQLAFRVERPEIHRNSPPGQQLPYSESLPSIPRVDSHATMYNDEAVKLLRERVNKKVSRQCQFLTYVSRDQHSLLPVAAALHRQNVAVSVRRA